MSLGSLGSLRSLGSLGVFGEIGVSFLSQVIAFSSFYCNFVPCKKNRLFNFESILL